VADRRSRSDGLAYRLNSLGRFNRYNIGGTSARGLSDAPAEMDACLSRLGILAPKEAENARSGKAANSIAMMVPGAGLEPALPLPGKGF
jgi:hypothetical protein